MSANCSFCAEPCIAHCMNRSLLHKHCEEDQRSGITITEILERRRSSAYIKYIEAVVDSDLREWLIDYRKENPCNEEMLHLREYYKFRIYVPLFAKSRSSQRALAYYYEKLKYYYNSIKRKLHITVDPSSSSDLVSISQTNVSTKEELLRDIRYEIQKDPARKQGLGICAYKSESKALEELLSYMRINSKFQQIKTLKTEDCFDQQHIFEASRSQRNLPQQDNHPVRTTIKSKLFKKIVEGPSGRKTPIQIQATRQRPPSRSKSNNGLKGKDIKQLTNILVDSEKSSKFNSPFRIRETEILKESRSQGILNKRQTSLGRLNQPHYSSPVSPYRKKQSKEKQRATSIPVRVKNSTISPFKKLQEKSKAKESLAKIKESIGKIQIGKIGEVKTKTFPNSPCCTKKGKSGFQLLNNDNILSIRKKKLQMLKEKISKKS